MKRIALITAALTLTPLASAQQGGQTGGRQPTPEMQARMKQLQPILDLAQNIRLLPQLEKNLATAMTRTQARQLLPILSALQKAAAVQPNDAKKYLAQIEDKIMTDRQLTALDDLQLRAEQERAARRAQAQASGGANPVRIPGVPGVGGFGAGGQRPGGQNGAQGPGGQGQGGSVQPGGVNPFKQGRQADALKAYIAILQKK